MTAKTIDGGLLILLADPSISSSNMGDQIISRAVREELAPLLARHGSFTVPTHTGMGRRGRWLLRKSSMALIAGTNLLSASVGPRQSWRQLPLPVAMRKFICAGVGWGSADQKPSRLAVQYLTALLHPKALHSVRDQRTETILTDIGFRAVYTGCPSMWTFMGQGKPPAAQPTKPARSCILVLNATLKNQEMDDSIVSAVATRYERVLFWRQSPHDDGYIGKLPAHFRLMPPSLEAYEGELSGDPGQIDVVTTRLHSAILAERFGARTTLFASDARIRHCATDAHMTWFDAPSSSGAAIRALDSPERRYPSVPAASRDTWQNELEELLNRSLSSAPCQGFLR